MVASVAGVGLLGWVWSGNALLFHSLSEIFSIVIACGCFMVAWNSRRFQVGNFVTFVGVAYLFVAALDALHMLAYRGMGVFERDDANLPTQLWIAARAVQAGSLLIAPLLIGRPMRMGWAAAGCGAVAAALASAAFMGIFPACYVEPDGLTPFKRMAEVGICAAILAAMPLLLRQRDRFDPDVLRLVLWSLAVTVGSELAFILYEDPNGPMNAAGHLLKIGAFYLIYKAIIETALAKPYDLLFRDLKQSEQSMLRAKAAAEAANSAKDHFLAVLSHELRNPLNPALLSVSAMLREPGLSAQCREGLDVIRRNVELEARLIDDLLDLTRISRDKLNLVLQRVDALELLRQAIHTCEAEIQGKGLRLRVELGTGPYWTKADPARLQQIFWNLIKNAVKFTPERGEIVILAVKGEENIAIEVTDTGIGIDASRLETIFDAFEQGDARITRQFGGLGLGLAITRALVHAHGGGITARSEGRGRGASFRVELPSLAWEGRVEVAEEDGAELERFVPGRLAILLVEDHEDSRRLMARLLRGLDHEVRTAGSVQEALREAEAGPLDLVISDLGLPDGSGLELMRELRRRQNARGICLSGYGMEEDIRRSKEAGFAEHLTKPIDLPRLTRAMANALRPEARERE